MRWTRGFIGTAALVLSGLATVNAQGYEQDPSSRVLRASYLQGDVSFRPGNVDDWTSATLNYPLTSGDHLWTDANARAELHVGANAIRLAPETAFEILDLDDNHLQIRLTQGSALLRIRTLDSDDDVEIDTPTGAVTIIRDGTYRVDVSADGATSTVTARNGDAEVTSNDNTIQVRPDETVLFTADGASQDVRYAPPMDEYDEWALARDRADDQSVSAQYVSRDMTGYEDLDRNGTWSDDADYGHVWIPAHVASDWAPYRYGRWAWVEPYGWTWIDDAPWGFAPFHYGRWAYVRDRWVWAPGEIRSRPVYAPALVVFVGGSGFGDGDDYRDRGYTDRGDVAWFPLAPREIYRPAYHTSDDYVRRVNVTNVNITNINVTNVNVTNIQYRNQVVQGATTAVSHDQFAGSQRIGRNAVVVPVSQARSAHVVGDGAPVTPTQQSVLVRTATTPVSRPPEAAQTRRVVVKNTPPAPPATFASHAAQLTTTGDKPVAPLPISQTRGAPRSGVTPGMSHADANTQVNRAPNTAPTHTVAPTTAVPAPAAPTTTARPVPNTRPNVDVRSQPHDEAQPATRPNGPPAAARTTEPPNVRTAPAAQPNENTRSAAEPQPNVNVRPAPAAQPESTRPAPRPEPNVNVRPAPAPAPRTNDRPNRNDGPSPVNGSANGSPAHTVGEPNPNTHPAPNPNSARPESSRAAPREQQQPPRAAAQDEKKSPAQGEKPQEATKAPPARGQGDRNAAPERRRDTTSDKENTKPPARDDRPPRRY